MFKLTAFTIYNLIVAWLDRLAMNILVLLTSQKNNEWY
jgi:hypothetical protein